MKKTLNRSPTVCAALIMTLIAIPAMAQQLSGNETRGTQLSAQWQHGPGVVARGPDGKVIFLFGELQPSVVCSPLQVCDIELQPGEIVRDVLLGDTVRWKVEPATSGAPNGQAVHLIVKPSEAGLVTSMVSPLSAPAHSPAMNTASFFKDGSKLIPCSLRRDGALVLMKGHAAAGPWWPLDRGRGLRHASRIRGQQYTWSEAARSKAVAGGFKS